MNTSGKKPTFFQMLIIAILFGILAGLVSELFYQTYFVQESPNSRDIIIQRQVSTDDFSFSQIDAIQEIDQSIVRIYRNTESEYSFLPDKVSEGFFFTNDGWVITTLLDEEPGEYIVYDQENQPYSVNTLIHDEVAQITYLHIDSPNVQALQFTSNETARVGEVVAVLSQDMGVVFSNIQSISYFSNTSVEDTILSTNRYNTFYSVDTDVAAMAPGSAVLDTNGRLVGILSSESYVIPVSHWRDQIDNVLRLRKIERMEGEITYRALDRLLSTSQKSSTGAEILSSTYKEIQVGDTIIEINGKPLSRTKTLTDALQEARSSVDILLIRNGVEVSVVMNL